MNKIAVVILIVIAAILLSQVLTVEEAVVDKQGAPLAKKIPFKLMMHGHERIDNYYWLREREDPKVLDYLNRENAYTEKSLAHLKPFRESLYQEMKARIKEEDDSLPYKKGDYIYWSRYLKGKEYAVYYRKKGEAGAEEILLDGNKMAEGQAYFNIGDFDFSADDSLMAFSTDTVGRNLFTIQIKNLETGEILPDKIENVSSTVVWAEDNKTFFYEGKDLETLREEKIYRYDLESNKSTLVYHEKDDTFWVGISKSKTDNTLFINSSSSLSSECRHLEADKPNGEFRLFQKRLENLEYDVYDAGNKFFILHNQGAQNFKLSVVSKNNTGLKHWEDFIPHRKEVLLENIEVFKDYLVLQERENALRHFKIFNLKTGEAERMLFEEQVYTPYMHHNLEYHSSVFRYSYESPTTPSSIYDYNMNDKSNKLLKQEEVLGDFDSKNYFSERLMVKVRDGVKVPLSLVYKKGMKRDGATPVLLYSYGSYGSSQNPYFSSRRLSLLDRGFIFAIAHVRGGEDMGRTWYDDGKILKKKNTFYDFIDCAEFLIKEQYTSADHLHARGASAGGLLMGAISNLRPNFFKSILADVPFVDVLTTMLDDSIPLTTIEYDEWGNPNNKEHYDYMLSYSPYDQVKKQDYPNFLVLTSLHDSQVQYFEPAKWVAKLRELKTDNNQLYIKIDMTSGHSGASGRFEYLKDYALQYAFIFDLEGIKK